MAFWPFRRRSTRKSSLSGAGLSSANSPLQNRGVRDLEIYNGADLSTAGLERRRSRRDKKRKPPRDAKKLQRDPQRAYSFSPGRNDSIRRTRPEDRPPIPTLPIDIKGKAVRAQTGFPESKRAGDGIMRASTQPQEASQWERMPTLHKRSPQGVARRKSSKRRREEHDREAEIKAMTAFLPNRPAAEPNSSGRLIKRESRKMRDGMDSGTKSSEISLPLSIHSSLSGSEHQASYKLSGFDMLSPRPTIRYSDYPKYLPPANVTGANRSESKKRKVSERVSIPEETLKANNRINELADDLDAGELRELMERDQKRRDKKKIADRIKMERRLARRQEKQKQEEAMAARDGTPPPVNLDRGVMGREVVVGLGIGTSAVVTSSKRKNSASSESGRGKRPSDLFRRESASSSIHSPYIEPEEPTPTSDRSDPIIETAKVGTVARASMSPPASPRPHNRGGSNISQLMDLNKIEAVKTASHEESKMQQKKPEAAAAAAVVPKTEPRRDSDSAARSSWTSFFKRRSKTAKHGSTPSSFSNTSRDSMNVQQQQQQHQQQQQQQQAPAVVYAPMITSSNIPKRTMSKFREDLPELPISPPDSRVQSPEAIAIPPKRAEQSSRSGNPSSIEDLRIRYGTPTSGYRSIDAMRARDDASPTSGNRSIDVPSPDQAMLSRSLASIDSEGSWLSGRKAGSKRGSAQISSYVLRDSANSLQKRLRDFSDSTEELGIAEDEYFSRLSPEPERRNTRTSGQPMPSSDEEEGSVANPSSPESPRTVWGPSVGRTPTVVHRKPGAKSREGLLNDFGDDDSSGNEAEEPPPAAATTNKEKRRSYGFAGKKNNVLEEGEGLYRATSIDLGRQHSRQISAGSAKLLDLKPRASGEGKRKSIGF